MAETAGETTGAAAEERLLTGYPGRILVLVALGTMVSFVGRSLFGPLLPAIVDDLGITSSQAGFALTVMLVALAVAQYPGGRLGDQLSYKTGLAAGIGIMTLGFLAVAGSSTYLGFVTGAAIIGLGGGLWTPSSYAQLSALFDARQGQAFGVYTASIDAGNALSGAVAVAVLAVAVWRVAYLPAAVLLVGVLVVLHVVHRDPYRVSTIDLHLRDTVGRVLGDAQIRGVLAAASLNGAVFGATIGFLPTLLQEAKGFSPTLAGNFFIGFFLVGIASRLLAGRLGDRYANVRVALATPVVGIAGLAVLWAAGSFPAIAAGVALLAAGLTGFWPVMNSYLFDLFPDGSMGGDFGAFRTLFQLVGSLGPTYVGFVAGRTDFALAPLLLGTFVAVGWLSMRY